MTYDEFLKKQKEILDECERLYKAGKYCSYMNKMQEFLDLGEQYLNEKHFSKEVL